MTSNLQYYKGVDSHLKEYLNHTYVLNNIQLPDLSIHYQEFINKLFETKKIDEKHMLMYACSILLTHLSLKIHGKLDTFDMSERQKQLAILMGDYCIGLNYNLMSQIQDARFIGIMAQGIERYSDLKVQLLQKEVLLEEQIFEMIANMEWTIFIHALEELKFDLAPFSEYKKLFFLEALEIEVNKLKNGLPSLYFQNIEGIEADTLLEKGVQYSKTLI